MLPQLVALLLSELIAIIIGLIYWKKIQPPYRVVVMQVATGFLVESVGWLIMKFHLGYNSWLFNIYSIAETLFLVVIFTLLNNNKRMHLISYVIAAVMLIWWVFTTYMQGLFILNNWYIITMALLAIVLFIALLINKTVFSGGNLYRQPVFIVSISYILFYASVIPLFGVFNYLIKTDYPLADKLQNINLGAGILRYALTGLALYLHSRNMRLNADK